MGGLELLKGLEVMTRTMRVVSQRLMGVVGVGKCMDEISIQRFHSGYNVCFHFIHCVIELILNRFEFRVNLLINHFIDHIDRSIK